MNLRTTLQKLVAAVCLEAERNPEFRANVERALGHHQLGTVEGVARNKGGRRAAAVLDPVAVARQSEAALRSGLAELGIEQLRDVVAQYGMDPGKLVMKWKDPQRVIDRIVEIAIARSTKGDVFRRD